MPRKTSRIAVQAQTATPPCPAEVSETSGSGKIEAHTVDEALAQLNERYNLMLSTHMRTNPRSFFEQVIPEFNAVLDTLQASKEGEEGGSPEGTQRGEQNVVCKSADEGKIVKGVRREIVSLITSKWIQKPKMWKLWDMGMEKDEYKRLHEFQALLRLYLNGRPGKVHTDPIEKATMKNVKIALGRLLVNQTHAQKLSYLQQTLEPLCCTYLPRTLDDLVDYFGLSVEVEEGDASSLAGRGQYAPHATVEASPASQMGSSPDLPSSAESHVASLAAAPRARQARLGSCLAGHEAERAQRALATLGIAVVTHSDSSGGNVSVVVVSSRDLEVSPKCM